MAVKAWLALRDKTPAFANSRFLFLADSESGAPATPESCAWTESFWQPATAFRRQRCHGR
jgi:hypothetical protein